jgi:hypothetical protein
MLLTGKYKGVTLFNHGWKMSKKKTYHISQIYWRYFPGNYWQF